MTDYRELLREIAVPRLTGSTAQSRIHTTLERELRARGFSVTRHPFRATLVSLHAVGLAGGLIAWMGAAAILFGGDESIQGAELSGPVAHVLVAAAVLILVLGTPLRGLVLGSRNAVAIGVNLVATKQPAPPRVWLTAHSDSKGQYFSMAGRIVLAAATATSGFVLLALAALAIAGIHLDGLWWRLAGVVALLGGAPLSLNGVLRDSPGAVDNATGLLTVLAVLDRLAPLPDLPVGVIVPDAEEWGLVGAAALTRDHPDLFRGTSIINFDGIDDRGSCIVFEHRSGRLGHAVARSLGVRPRRWLPVVVDGVAFNRGAELDGCVTVMRGNAATMRIVHTVHDDASRLTLAGVEQVAPAVAEALRLDSARSRP